VTFWLWPLACFAAGGPALLADARRLRRHLRHARRLTGSPPGRFSLGALAIGGFGIAGVSLLYLNILTPLNVGYDARWYHFALAEHYAAAGAIARFPEGFFGAAWPHFASWLYTWAFLSPGSLFFHMELAAHLELAVFLATLGGVPILVRWILRGRRAPRSWAAVFLFPGILLYDSSLSGAADHVLAFWLLAVLIAVARLWRSFERSSCLLLACVAAGAALTKYQAVSGLAFPALAAAGAVIIAVRRRTRTRSEGVSSTLGAIGSSVGLALLAFLILFAPHWLKNLAWHGDPFYPMLRGFLADRPWTPDAVEGFAVPYWLPQGSLFGRLGEATKVAFTFSFVPHDWAHLHGAVPVFGSLFTLSLLPQLFLRGMSRGWVVSAAALTGLIVWFLTYHPDRYLQALLPWMAAVVAAVVIRSWESGRASRVAVVGAVALQIVWGADVYAFPTHSLLWNAPAHAVLDLVSSGYRQDWDRRFATGNELETLAPRLPKGSKLLVHESEMHLGSGAMAVTDARGAQGGIDYSALRTPRAIWELLASYGVTHLVWKPGSMRAEQRLSDEVAFLNFAVRHAEGEGASGALRLARMPARPPPAMDPAIAVTLCGRTFSAALVDLAGPAALAPDWIPGGGHPAAAVTDVWLVHERCPSDRLPDGYVEAGRFAPFAIGIRRDAGK